MAYSYWESIWVNVWKPYLSCVVTGGKKYVRVERTMHAVCTTEEIVWLRHNTNIHEMHEKYFRKYGTHSLMYSTCFYFLPCKNSPHYYPWKCYYSHCIQCRPFVLDYDIFMNNMVSTTNLVFMHEFLQTQQFTVPTLFERIFFDDYLTKIIGKY